MTLQVPLVGLNAAEFVVSPVPWVTSSATFSGASDVVRYDFPGVTKFVKVRNTDATNSLFVGFTTSVTGSKSYEVVKGTETTFDVRCKQIFLFGNAHVVSFSLIAGLTGVDTRFLPNFTGTNV